MVSFNYQPEERKGRKGTRVISKEGLEKMAKGFSEMADDVMFHLLRFRRNPKAHFTLGYLEDLKDDLEDLYGDAEIMNSVYKNAVGESHLDYVKFGVYAFSLANEIGKRAN